MLNPFGTKKNLGGAASTSIFHIPTLESQGLAKIDRLPFSIRVLVENTLRQVDGKNVTESGALAVAKWQPKPGEVEVPYLPARVVLQDFTGVPVIVDLIAMRGAMKKLGGDVKRINPIIPTDLVIDHSVQVDNFGTKTAELENVTLEFERNTERYITLRWAQRAFENLRIVPPGTGIVHQVNLEYLASVVVRRQGPGGEFVAFPDSCIGTDSHTPMVNGLGVMGWGVGGIEAEAVMLGQPYYMLAPEVVGFKVVDELPAGVTATDLVLAVTQRLRKAGVVNKFVEFFGPGLRHLTVEDRATLANMAPEYGATMGFFPVDARTLDYLRFTGRPKEVVDLVERYTKENALFRTDATPDPEFSEVIEFSLASVVPSLAGPKRPQDRVPLNEMKKTFHSALVATKKDRGFELPESALANTATVQANGKSEKIAHGAVVIAAITSCTNTSNPSVMVAAGLLAKKANARGLKVRDYVKTSLAPGSLIVTDYLKKSGLLTDLEALKFNVVGYGCTTCIGNSGPLPEPVAKAVVEGDLVAAAVLSGNRNFEARINPHVKANYLASPPLVVAYALAGTVDIDFEKDPVGTDKNGKPVMLKEIWPSIGEVREVLGQSLTPEMYATRYSNVFEGDQFWRALPVPSGDVYNWDAKSTYIQEPPYFQGMSMESGTLADIKGAVTLAVFGDSITTDHISPAGDIKEKSPAGAYLKAQGVEKKDFNSYGSRRGNHQVMIRGTFANVRIKNLLVAPDEGGDTIYHPTGERMTIYDAAQKYIAAKTPLVILAGKEYGTGSSRDWAAKGTRLLGVAAVIAETYERIHRSNLVGMGVLPLQFKAGESRETYGLTGNEAFDIVGIDKLAPGKNVTVIAHRKDGSTVKFEALARIDTPADLEIYRHGGILPMTVRRLAK